MDKIDTLAMVIATSRKMGNKVLVFGNGGLCAESEHFSAELAGKYAFDIYAPCISLTSNTSLLTAIANDFGYENIFSHQVKVFGNAGDVCIGMTTSKSENVIWALTEAKKMKMVSVVICGGKFTDFNVDYQFIMQGNDTAEIQNETMIFLHKLAFEIKRRLV